MGNEAEGGRLHLYFRAQEPARADRTRLEGSKGVGERWALQGRVFYSHTPGGAGNSKLAAQAEKALGVSAIARNWRTVGALLELAAADRAGPPLT